MKSYFKYLFSDNIPEIYSQDRSLLNIPISLEEIKSTIKKLYSNCAAGPDEIAAGLVKYTLLELHRITQPVLNKYFEQHKLLKEAR